MLITAKEIITKSVETYQANWKKFLPYMIMIFIPALLTGFAGLFSPLNLESNFTLGLWLYIALVIVFSIFTIWFSSALVKTIAAAIENKKMNEPKKEILDAKKYIIPIILASILTGIIIFLGVIFFVIPGIIFAIWFAFISYEIILEDKKIMESLRNSKALVTGRWWAVLWRLFAPGIVFALIIWIGQLIIGMPFAFIKNNISEVIGNLLIIIEGTAVAVIIAPLSSIAPTMLYLDLKKNKQQTEAIK
jgi:hypothetical protein